MHFYYVPGEYPQQINVFANKTSLVVSHTSKISILNFWEDQINKEGQILPVELISTEEDENQDGGLGVLGKRRKIEIKSMPKKL